MATVSGLVKRPDLNGFLVELIRYDIETERYEVQFVDKSLGGKKIALKADNLIFGKNARCEITGLLVSAKDSTSSSEGTCTGAMYPAVERIIGCLDLDMLGVSVHWLKTGFMGEIRAAGLNEKSKVYEVENLKAAPGVIRTKGTNVRSPIDKKMGAAYVHCLKGDDNVGMANYMLSYGWGYTIGDIADTLYEYCRKNKLNQKRTYIWICSLCNNQHRVVEDRQNGKDVPFEEFHDIFYNRVTNIKHILAMMAPWNDPLYIKRVWCVFELFTAYKQKECNVEIIMPQTQKDAMADAVIHNDDLCMGINKLYDVLSNIDVQKANASVEEDKIKILQMIKKDIGFTKLNNGVNDLFRQWVRNTIDEIVEKRSNEVYRNNSTIESDLLLPFSDLCYNVGRIFWRNGELDESLKMYNKCLEIDKNVLGEEHERVASVYNNIGLVLIDQGDYDGALTQHNKCLNIEKSVLGENHPSLATSYNNIGLVLYNKGDYDGALIQYNKSLTIDKTVLGENHPNVATSYNNIGEVHRKKGDYDDALMQYNNALTICESVLGENHPNVAFSYNNIGCALHGKGCYNQALVEFHKALDIFETSLGDDHPDTKVTKGWIERINHEIEDQKNCKN